MPIRFPKLLLSVGFCLVVGFVGSIFTFSAIPTWYMSLNKPIFSPPNWVFGPVWTTLYILMGVSFYLVWISRGKVKLKAVKTFFIQLGLNALWSILFFGLKDPRLALLEIIILWVSIFLTIKYFFKLSKTSSYLLIPYLFWVSFASLLNLFIVVLN